MRTRAQDGVEERGAVRGVRPDGRSELLVNLENSGGHCLPLAAIVDVHDEKIAIDLKLLQLPVRCAVAHAHEAEAPGRCAA